MEIVRKPEKRTQVIYNLLDWPDLPPFGIDGGVLSIYENMINDLERILNDLKNPWVSFRNGRFWITPPPTSETWKAVEFKSANLYIRRYKDDLIPFPHILFKSSIANYGNGIILESPTEPNMDYSGIKIDLGENWKSRPIDIVIDTEFYIKNMYRKNATDYESFKSVFDTKGTTFGSINHIINLFKEVINPINKDVGNPYYNFEYDHDNDPNVAIPGGDQTNVLGLFLNVTWIG